MRTLLYDMGLSAYRLAVRAAAPFSVKAALFVAGRRGLIPKIESVLASEPRPRVWLHCASLGEFEQGRPVLERLRSEHPECAFVVTFFSPSGYEVRKNFEGADYVYYLPEDTRKNAQELVRILRPKLALFVKYDLWLHLLRALAAADVPVVLFAARFRAGQGYFKWWGGIQREMLRRLSKIFVQDETSAVRLRTIGVDSEVAGDTRFDRVIQAAENASQPLPELELFSGGAKLIVAGSTWPRDEACLAAALPSLAAGWKLVLVPHEVNEAHLSQIESAFSGRVVRWGSAGADVLLVDRVGLLLQIFRHASVAYIGGGFGRAGIHNVLEPAVFGLPVIHGPVFHQFVEAEGLAAAGGSVVVNDAADLRQALGHFTSNESARFEAGAKGKSYVRSGGGATEKICDYLAAKYWLMTL